jgi:hypothetical protein
MLGARDELTPPITATIHGAEDNIFQFRLPDLKGRVEFGELPSLKVERSVCWPSRIVFEDAGGQNAFDLKLEPPMLQWHGPVSLPKFPAASWNRRKAHSEFNMSGP